MCSSGIEDRVPAGLRASNTRLAHRACGGWTGTYLIEQAKKDPVEIQMER